MTSALAAVPPRGDDPVADWLAGHAAELVALRRILHARPELSREEHGTTSLLAARLAAAGLDPVVLPAGTGLWCDVGGGGVAAPTVLLRADLDALPLEDEKQVDYRSAVPGVCHACGHDVHTAVVLGAGLALAAADRRSPLPGRVRLLFQPAEEVMPGGALDVVAAGVLEPVDVAFALHCDPSLDLGHLGLQPGPITAAADRVEVRVSGPGGHTSRPYLTVDLVTVLARVAAEVPAALGRLVDPREALSLTWGAIAAGRAANAIPRVGTVTGTLRVLGHDGWAGAPELVERLVRQVAEPYGAQVELDYRRGVPPVVNEEAATAVLAGAAESALGPGTVVPTPQSLGGEDFGWYLEHVAGAMARLGTRTPGGPTYDLHQGRFDVDERAIGVGARVLAQAALDTLRPPVRP